MKKKLIIPVMLMAAALLAAPSCQREETVSRNPESALRENPSAGPVRLKAGIVDELPSALTVAAYTASGSSFAWKVSAALESEGDESWYSTSRMWPYNASLSFCVTNAAADCVVRPSAGSAPVVKIPDCETDYLYCLSEDPVYGEPVEISLAHALSRVGTLSYSVPEGYSFSLTSFTFTAYTSGAVNPGTGAYYTPSQYSSAFGASMSTHGESLSLGANDVWCIPGTYSCQAVFTVSKGEYVRSYTRTGSLTFARGELNNICVTVSDDDAVECTFTVSIQPWVSQNLDF